jgi:hypothetical protein
MFLTDSLRGVRQWCLHWFGLSPAGDGEDEDADDFFSFERPLPDRRTGYLAPEDFASVLSSLGQSDRDERLHVFSFSDYREALGVKWERVKDLVHVASDQIIKSHIDSGKDIFTRLDEETACLVLPRAPRQHARACVAAIAKQLSSNVFGDVVIDGKRLEVVATNLAWESALNGRELDGAAIRRAVAAARPPLMAVGTPGARPRRMKLSEAPPLGPGEHQGPNAASDDPERFKVDFEFQVASLDPTAPAWLEEQLFAQAAEALEKKKRRQKAKMARGLPIPPAGGAGEAAADEAGGPANGGSAADSSRIDFQFQIANVDPSAPAWLQEQLDAQKAEELEKKKRRQAAQMARGLPIPPAGPSGAVRAALLPPGTKTSKIDFAFQVAAVDKSSPAWLEEQLYEQASQSQGQTHHTHLKPESTLSLLWTPTWVTNKRRIGAFHARVIRLDSEIGPTLEAGEAYEGISPIEVLTLDRFVAAAAAHELNNQFFSHDAWGLTVPVHWISLAPRWRECIRLPFEKCPPKARRKLLKIEIFGLDPSISSVILRSMFDPLERLGCDIMARLPLGAPEMISSLRSVRAVGVDLSELDDAEKVGDEELFKKLARFRDAARSHKLACYVWGVRRRALIARIVRAGFSLVNGPGVMRAVPNPRVAQAAMAAKDE